MVSVSINELRYLRELFSELKQEVDHSEIDDAIDMIDGLIEEGRKLNAAKAKILEQTLNENKHLMAGVNNG